MLKLATPGVDQIEQWTATELDGLFDGEARRSAAFRGGQSAADQALAQLDINGYARRRSLVDPPESRGASKLSPYIRHGLIDLPSVHDHPSVRSANSFDRFKYRGELLWQDYSRQWYAVYGTHTRRGVVHAPQPGKRAAAWDRTPWPRDMRCVDATLSELHTDGWMVNQTRMWLASQWAVRSGADWTEGEDHMFRHLLDGSRAANRQGWQWVVGGTRSRSYGFSRRQVMKRAPDYCASCELSDACPIGAYPGSVAGPAAEPTPSPDVTRLTSTATSSPASDAAPPEAVWLTAESLGDDDPALRAHPTLPAHFVFDEPLLSQLRLDGKRLVFLADCLADLAQRRELVVWRGNPADLLNPSAEEPRIPTSFAVTATPVPGFTRLAHSASDALSTLPWRWLRPPTPALVAQLQNGAFPSFKQWCQLTKPT